MSEIALTGSEIIRSADSEIVPNGTVKLPPLGGGSGKEWQPYGLRNSHDCERSEAISPALMS